MLFYHFFTIFINIHPMKTTTAKFLWSFKCFIEKVRISKTIFLNPFSCCFSCFKYLSCL
nr:MAG TPA: hypothetical protein [Bacteriophage sp.]